MYVFLLLLIGVGNAEINAENTKGAKEIFLKVNQRLKHGTFDNIKIDFSIVYIREVKDPETEKVSWREQIRDINLVRKGKLFRKNERYIFDGSHDFNKNQSWNGAFSVSYDETMQHEKEKRGIKNNTKEMVLLSEKDEKLDLQNYLFNIFHLRGERGIDLSFTEFYLKEGDILIARSSDNKIREEIHLTDIENALYNKIETYSNDKLIQTHFVEEWTEIGGKYLPTKTSLVIDGKKHGPYEIKNIDFDPDYSDETFTLKIPYSEKFIIYNLDTHERFFLSQMDKQSWENGDYIKTFYDHYDVVLENALLEPMEDVEDVTDDVVLKLTEAIDEVATGELVIDESASINDKEDIIRESDNNIKVSPLFYIMGGLLLLGIIGFAFKPTTKSKRQK